MTFYGRLLDRVSIHRCWTALLLALAMGGYGHAAEYVETPYTAQRVVFDFYFNEPAEIGPALFWLRSLMNPLMDSPYGYAPEDLDIKVVIHGAELVVLARSNEKRYAEAVARMRYYADLGVQFKVCAMAAEDYGYGREDFQDFVDIVPSGITELAHWQLQGYAMIRPQILEKKHAIEEIR